MGVILSLSLPAAQDGESRNPGQFSREYRRDTLSWTRGRPLTRSTSLDARHERDSRQDFPARRCRLDLAAAAAATDGVGGGAGRCAARLRPAGRRALLSGGAGATRGPRRAAARGRGGALRSWQDVLRAAAARAGDRWAAAGGGARAGTVGLS